jgi:hypothetical protein
VLVASSMSTTRSPTKGAGGEVNLTEQSLQDNGARSGKKPISGLNHQAAAAAMSFLHRESHTPQADPGCIGPVGWMPARTCSGRALPDTDTEDASFEAIVSGRSQCRPWSPMSLNKSKAFSPIATVKPALPTAGGHEIILESPLIKLTSPEKTRAAIRTPATTGSLPSCRKNSIRSFSRSLQGMHESQRLRPTTRPQQVILGISGITAQQTTPRNTIEQPPRNEIQTFCRM